MSDLWRAGFADSASIHQLEELQRELNRLQQEVSPEGMEATLTLAVGMLHRYGSAVVHTDSGRLKNSLFWRVNASGRRGSAIWGTNVQYSIYEEARGGDHAFVGRTARSEGPAVERIFGVRISGRRA